MGIGKGVVRSSKIFLYTMLASTFSAVPALADPPPEPRLPAVFCFRLTDIEARGGDSFAFEFEVLNWTDQPAFGLQFEVGENSSRETNGSIPQIVLNSIDPDGRGPDGIGQGSFDPIAIHSGRGRGDVPGLLNDWSATSFTSTSARWSAGSPNPSGTPIPNRDLLGAFNSGGLDAAQALIPGAIFTTDATGDTAIDGGPGPYSPNDPAFAGPPDPDGSGTSLDGFVIEVNDFNLGEVLTLNWDLLDAHGNSIGGGRNPGSGNTFGFGGFALQRSAGSALPNAGALSGFGQGLALGTADAFEGDGSEFVLAFGGGAAARVPEPHTYIGSLILLTLGYVYKRRVAKRASSPLKA